MQTVTWINLQGIILSKKKKPKKHPVVKIYILYYSIHIIFFEMTKF